MQFKAPLEVGAAVAGMANGRSVKNPAETAELASRIAEPDLRWRTLDGFVVEWLRNDPAGAEKWLASSQIVAPEWAANWLQEGRGKR